MNQATTTLSQRIAIAFDFDRTLIPDDSFHVLLKDCQIEVDDFISDRVDPLFADGWDRYLAKAYCLVKESQQRKQNKITSYCSPQQKKFIENRNLLRIG